MKGRAIRAPDNTRTHLRRRQSAPISANRRRSVPFAVRGRLRPPQLVGRHLFLHLGFYGGNTKTKSTRVTDAGGGAPTLPGGKPLREYADGRGRMDADRRTRTDGALKRLSA